MRLYTLALAASATAIVACSGGGEKSADTSASMTTDTSQAAATTTPAAGGAAGGATGAATAGAAAITGKTIEVKMVGDDKGYRFEPANVTVKAGDGVKWVTVSGGPHNVAFDNVPADSKDQLKANMPNQMSELSSPMMMNPNEAYTVSFANVKPGTYAYHCTPHLAMGMKGQVTVQ